MSDNIELTNIDKLIEDELKCNFCGKIFLSKSALNLHKRTAKYCLKQRESLENTIIDFENQETIYECEFCEKKFTRKDYLKTHLSNCKNKKTKDTIFETEKKIEKETERYLTEIDILKKKLEKKNAKIQKLKHDNELKIIEYKERELELNKQIQTLEQSISNIALKASTKPTTSNSTKNKTIINNLPPFSYDDLKACADALTIEHIEKGIEGHAELIIPFLKGKMKCTDSSRRTMKYNIGDETIIDPKGLKVISAYSQNIFPRNDQLTKQYREMLSEKLKTSESIESALLIDQGFRAENLNDQIKGAAKGEDTKFVTKLSGKISLATI